MLTFFVLCALANVVLNYYLLNIIESPFAIKIVEKNGISYYYIVSALIGFIAIPIIFMAVVCEFIKKG